METAIGEFKKSNWITDKLTPEAWVTKFKAWTRQTTSWVVDKLTSAFQQVVIKGYNMAKESMAKEKKLKFKPCAPTADQLVKLPDNDTKSRNWITRWIRQKAFNIAAKLINKLFKYVIDSTQKELQEKADEFIEENIVKNAPFWKGWLKAHLTRMFGQILESLKSQTFALFNHAKRAIATGADLKYNELLDIKNTVPKTPAIQAKIEYFNQLIETAAVKEYDDLLDYQ